MYFHKFQWKKFERFQSSEHYFILTESYCTISVEIIKQSWVQDMY